MQKVVFITGGTSGIGEALTRLFLKHGLKVYEMSRRASGVDGSIHIQGDVTKEEDLQKAIQWIEEAGDCVDFLINNAGFGISGAAEFADFDRALEQIDVNFLSATRVTSIFLPMLRKSQGRIIFTSSVAGAIPIPFQAFYSASKAAINTYAMALANEVRPFGVSVTSIMLGDTRTGFTKARKKNETGDELYQGKISASVQKMEKDERNGMMPEKVAKLYWKVMRKKKVKPLYVTRFDYKLLVFLSRILPVRFVNWIVSKIYA